MRRKFELEMARAEVMQELAGNAKIIMSGKPGEDLLNDLLNY